MSEAATKPRSSDPRVAAAITHWAPRFVSNGVLLADFEEVTAGIERWEDWCRAWCARGEVHEIRICGDYERAARAVCDGIERRADLDAARIAMWGVSLGGYYAPRATAYEKRIKACIALSGPFEWKEIWAALPLLTREAFRVRSHSATEADALKNAPTLSMKDAASKIACPIFIVTWRQDRLVPASTAERLAQSVSSPVDFLIVEDGGHNANNRPYRYRSRTADWLPGQLGLPRI